MHSDLPSPVAAAISTCGVCCKSRVTCCVLWSVYGFPDQQTMRAQQILSVQIADRFGIRMRDFEQQGRLGHPDPEVVFAVAAEGVGQLVAQVGDLPHTHARARA